MAPKVEKVKTVRAHLVVLVITCICLGIISCWYAAKTSEVYDKMRNVDFHIPEEVLADVVTKAGGEEKVEGDINDEMGENSEKGSKLDIDENASPSTNEASEALDGKERRRREVGREGTKYYRLRGTPIEAIMSVFENAIEAVAVSNSLCYSTGIVSILSSFWFLAAHFLIFESGRKDVWIRFINWAVYLALICLAGTETVLLSKKMAVIPVMKKLADNIPLHMEHGDLYNEFISVCGTTGPVLIINMYLVIIIVSWFQARIVLTKFFSSIYETKEMEMKEGP